MTKRTIENSRFELARLKTRPIASSLLYCCREHNADSDFDFFYRNACKVHLRNMGRQAGIDDDTMMDKDDHSSELVEKKEVVKKC
jgi:hypothetical protein